MLVKQFKTGYEAKSYIAALKKKYEAELLNDMESFENGGIEYGYILQKAIEEMGNNFEVIDLSGLRNYSITFSEELEKYFEENKSLLLGNTVKFKLSKEADEYIDELTGVLSSEFHARIYRAFTVKLLLKNLYLKSYEEKSFLKK